MLHAMTGWNGRLVRAALLLTASLFLPLHASAQSPDLREVLDRAGYQVEQFWRHFSAVTCTETVDQVKLSEKGKVLNQRQAEYDYVIFMQLTGKELRVEESREVLSETRPKKKKRPSQRALLITNGFPILKLVFHPNFQSRYFFRLEAGLDSGLLRVQFEQVPGAEPLSILRLKDRDYPLAWAGTAWIEPATGVIERIQTHLVEPMKEVGLQSLTSDVRYSEVPFQAIRPSAAEVKNGPASPVLSGDATALNGTEKEGTQISYWLPRRADVEARTGHQHWRNTHQFTDYRRFAVNTAVSIGEAP